MIAAPSLARIQRRHWALVLGTVLLAALTGKPGAGGVLLGGGVIGLSVFLYALGLESVLRRTRPLLAIGLLFAKLAAFLGLGWLAFTAGKEHRPDPIGFAVGVTCFPAAAVWEAMRTRGS
jgi:hypothetical protein